MSSPADRWAVRADTVLTPGEELDGAWVLIDGDRIEAVGRGRPPDGTRLVDLGDRVLAPGFVDLHVHGGDGAQVNGATADEVAESVRTIARLHVRHGTTALVPTTVSDTPDRLIATVRGIADATDQPEASAAYPLGAHLEGPWIASSRAGAQDRRCIRPPDTGELGALMTAARDTIRLVTVAPELPGGEDLIRFATAHGVAASVGHTDADAATARRAFGAGARHVTHLFNAMPGIHHREPGPVVAALADPRVSVEVIADAVHLAPEVLALVLAVAPGRVTAVTDAMAATGLGPGRYRLGSLDADVREDRATLSDDERTLAGSVLTMERAVSVLVSAGVSLPVAVTAATATPAGVIGASTRGRLAPGMRADLVALEPDLSVAAVVVGGIAAHNPVDALGSVSLGRGAVR